jgi:hypothetical protein
MCGQAADREGGGNRRRSLRKQSRLLAGQEWVWLSLPFLVYPVKLLQSCHQQGLLPR